MRTINGIIAGYAIGLSLLLGTILGFVIFSLRRYLREGKVVQAKESAKKITEEARREAESKKKEAVLEAKEEAHKILSSSEREIRERRSELQKAEHRISQKEENIEKRLETLKGKEKEFTQWEEEAKKGREEVEELKKEQNKTLESISGLTVEEAKKLLLKNIESEVRHEAAKLTKEIEAEAKEDAERRAREIVSLAIQHCAVDQVVESTVSVVPLPNDEMKGRLIGREGRNIRCFETLSGVDLIVDDTPEAVVISAFDPIRREIAKNALEKLILDGRIQPARIEEIIEKSKREIEERIQMEGENAALEMGVAGLHPEVIKLLGRLHFRTSYGQNVLQNSKEAAHLAGAMAAELGANIALTRRAALLHDIGKAVSLEVEGPHAVVGADLAKRYRESKGVVHAIAAHHGEEEPQTIEAVLVQVADAISGARPGARRETLEGYIKRLERLEEIADSFPGVEKTYAIQAGREIRIMVKPEAVDDLLSVTLSRDIAKKIEEELQYPGQIKVTVIRETRAIEYAK